MHEKMLKAISLYWFHKDASERNIPISGHSNKLWINE